MKIKTSEATGLRLDWGVGTVLQLEKLQLVEGGVIYKPSSGGRQVPRHTDPAVCMGLMNQIGIMQQATDGSWCVAAFCSRGKEYKAHGQTLAQAVARCIIAMRLGDEFEVPDELGVMS